MMFWGCLLTILALFVQANAGDHCVMRGECGVDDVTGLKRPCVYNGNAVPPNSTKAIDILNELCPDLKTGPDSAVCCSDEQLQTLKTKTDILAEFFKRCPSCFHNIATLFCEQICSPIQSSFLEVTASSNNSVDELNFYVTEHFSQAVFDSCKNVQLPFSPGAAMSITCGAHSTDCTAHYWFDYMGGHDPSPYQMNFHYETVDNVTAHNVTFYPMNETVIPCSQPYGPEGIVCSCADCSCNPQPPPLPPAEKYFMGLPRMAGIMLLVYIALATIIIGGFACYGRRRTDDDEQLLIAGGEKWQKAPSVCERWGASLDNWLKKFFTRWATFCASYPITVLFMGLLFVIFFSSGLYFFTVRTNPVELWSAPSSDARIEKKYFDEHFGPFYRTEQVIIRRKSGEPIEAGGLVFSPVFDRSFLHQILQLQKNITDITVERNNKTVRFEDICYAPLQTNSSSDSFNSSICMIQSVVNWFQNDPNHLDYYNSTEDYLNFLKDCTSNPLLVRKQGLSCLGEYGGPIYPYIALGGIVDDAYANATALILTFMVNNHINDEDNQDAIEWEKKFLEFIKSFKNPDMEISFSAERSIQDEIDRESKSDEATIIISYLVMFVYVSITLGQYHSLQSLLIKSKILLGLSGVLIVLASVVCSLGIFSYLNVPATLIIIEVIPFLVLAVGVDNIFIMVQTYQRSSRAIHETRQQHIGRVIGQIIPSILLASFAESACFLMGGLSSMPAVHVFALYSGVAVFIDFLLQITCFIAVLSLDVAREESKRMDICCCVKMPESEHPAPKHGFLYRLFEKHYAPFLMKNPVRCIVLLFFSGWLCLSIANIENIEIGLDQKLAMPKDSYVLDYFKALEDYLSVGPPVYFVVKDGYQYSEFVDQNALCSGQYCYQKSLVTQITEASQFANRTYIAHPPLDWLDSYFSWTNNQGSCCLVLITDKTKFCNSTDEQKIHCTGCNVSTNTTLRPYPEKFYEFLQDFLDANPSEECPNGGHAAFAKAVIKEEKGPIEASHFMAYHTILKTSEDYIGALKSAVEISDNITKALRNYNVTDPDALVFPYSIFYVYYEQYLTISRDAVISLGISVAEIFVVTLLLMGLDFHSAVIMVFTILMILQDLLGLMAFWGISMNAVSLVNLVMAVGICVEFCSHIIRCFAFATEGSKVDRARYAVATMGSSVLSGITLTKFGGIIVLAFSKSQIFQIFYFRMYLGIVLIGAAHGLIFLPVFLSIFGPPVKHTGSSMPSGKPLKASMNEETNDKDVDLTHPE